MGGLGPRAPSRRGGGLSLFVPLAAWPFSPPSRRWVEERGERRGGGDGEGYRGRGGAAYDPGQARAPSQLVYTLPRTIDNEPWRTAVVYCREFFGWPTESPTPNSFLHPRQNDLGRPRSLVKVKRGDAQLVK